MTKTTTTFVEHYKQMFDNLRAPFPDIVVSDVVVCRQIYSTERDEVQTCYDEIVARLEHATLDQVPHSLWNEVFIWFSNKARKLNKTDEQIQAGILYEWRMVNRKASNGRRLLRELTH